MKKYYRVVGFLMLASLLAVNFLPLPVLSLVGGVDGLPVAHAQNKKAKNDLPKMVSLRWQKVNVRKGPGKKFPIVFSLQQKGMPLKMTRRHGDWRAITDWEGGNGWILRDAISDQKTLIVHVDETDLTADPNKSNTDSGRLVAKLKRGVTAKIIKCEPQWCKVQTFIGARTGWLRALDTKIKF